MLMMNLDLLDRDLRNLMDGCLVKERQDEAVCNLS